MTHNIPDLAAIAEEYRGTLVFAYPEPDELERLGTDDLKLAPFMMRAFRLEEAFSKPLVLDFVSMTDDRGFRAIMPRRDLLQAIRHPLSFEDQA